MAIGQWIGHLSTGSNGSKSLIPRRFRLIVLNAKPEAINHFDSSSYYLGTKWLVLVSLNSTHGLGFMLRARLSRDLGKWGHAKTTLISITFAQSGP